MVFRRVLFRTEILELHSHLLQFFTGFELLNTQGHRQLNRVRIMIKQLIVIFFAYEFVPDHAIPNLFGYIIVMMILTVLPGLYSRSTTFDDELSLCRFSSSYHFALNSKLDFEFVSYSWFQ